MSHSYKIHTYILQRQFQFNIQGVQEIKMFLSCLGKGKSLPKEKLSETPDTVVHMYYSR